MKKCLFIFCSILIIKMGFFLTISNAQQYEIDTDRPGGDYINFNLDNPNPDLCYSECLKDSRCKAFTYVKPGVQGNKAKCWLKTTAPAAKHSSYCISWVKNSTVYAASLENRVSAPVIVVNPDSKPIPVTEGCKYPVQEDVTATFYHGIMPYAAQETIYVVPEDKRLVIEYFSCRSCGSYDTSYSCSITTGESPGVEHCLPSTPYGHSFIPIAVGPGSEQLKNFPAWMSAGQAVKIYAGPGTHVFVKAYRQNKDRLNWVDLPDENIVFSFSGYLEDILQ